jgi:acetoin:2,6-dichlorophenolindophenol oxidoreductase subunit beta
MRDISYAEVLADSIEQGLKNDDRVYVIGGPFFGLTPKAELFNKVAERYPKRVLEPPTSEMGYCGLAVGAAMAGLRPIVDLGTASFVFNAWPIIANEASLAYYMNNGKTTVPVIFHVLHGIRGGGASQHSHSPLAMFWNMPGLEIMAPSSPSDLKGLFMTALTRDNPVIFADHTKLFNTTEQIPDNVGKDSAIPFGKAAIKRKGKDVTVVAFSLTVLNALGASTKLSAEGIDVEVIDPRTIVPLDKKTILESVAKTGRLVIVEEGQTSCGIASEISALVSEYKFNSLKAPIRRVAVPDVPIPFSKTLEAYISPTEDRIIKTIHSVVD